jgi:hypothetical protein
VSTVSFTIGAEGTANQATFSFTVKTGPKAFVLTIEPDPDPDPAPSKTHILADDIVDPCSALGPVGLDGDPNGNENDAVNIDPQMRIRPHRGIQDNGDLTDAHSWHGRIARVTVTRLYN